MTQLQRMKQQLAMQTEEIDLLVQHWEAMISNATGGVTPSRTQFALWLRINDNDLDVVMAGIDATSRKNHMMGDFRLRDSEAIRYASGCMKREHLDKRMAASRAEDVRASAAAAAVALQI